MIELGEHAEFILGAYGGVFLGILALIVWAVIDRRRIAARLRALGDTRQ
jgi:heme exporter protein CcmD